MTNFSKVNQIQKANGKAEKEGFSGIEYCLRPFPTVLSHPQSSY